MSGDAVILDPPSDRSRPGVLTSVRAHLVTIVAALLAGAALGFLGSELLPTSYTAQSAFYLGATAPFTPGDKDPGGDAVRFTADQAELAQTTEVLEAAGKSLSPPIPLDEVRKSVTAVASVDTSKVTVTADRPEAAQSQALADAVVAFYRAAAARRVSGLVSSSTRVDADPVLRRDIELRAAAYGDGVVAVEPAELPDTASSPLPLQNALIAGLLAAALATAAVVIGDQRRARRASIADLDLLIGAPLITRHEAPSSDATTEMIKSSDSRSEVVRSGNDVLTAIDVAFEGTPNPSVLFLSWQRALTTTSLVVSVALAATRAGRKVVVVDGGLKERGISALTDVDPAAGLEALANPASPIGASLRSWRIGKVEVGVVPLDGWSPTLSGAAARPQVLRSAVDRLREVATLTVVDGPPLTERSVGLALGRGVDGVILVIDEETSVDDAHEMGRRIALAGMSVLGYVLVGPSARLSMSRMTWSPQRHGEGPLSLGAARTSHRR
jgi:capsular polysaccharide biosynthesis protein